MKRSLGAGLGLLMFSAACAQAQIFTEDFSSYTPGSSGVQYQSGLPVFASGSVTGWTITGGGGHAHAVDYDPTTGIDYAIMLFSGSNVPSQDVLTLNTAQAANDNGTTYRVSFDAAPAVYAVGSQATTATDAVLVEILRQDNSVLASYSYQPGAWAGSQTPFSPTSFDYVGDGSGDVRIRLATDPAAVTRFGGAIDNLELDVAPSDDPLAVPILPPLGLLLLAMGLFSLGAFRIR